MKKKCRRCGLEKETDLFTKGKSLCKKCVADEEVENRRRRKSDTPRLRARPKKLVTPEDEVQLCRVCEKSVSVNLFNERPDRPGYRYTICRPCDLKRSKDRYELLKADPSYYARKKTERRNKKRARELKKVRQTCRSCKKRRKTKFFRWREDFNGWTSVCADCKNKKGRNRRKERVEDGWSASDSALWTKYRMRQKDWDELFAKQNGLCSICKENPPTVVDHDHLCCPSARCCSYCIRGLLCGRCNSGIGFLYDNPEILESAANYIRNHCRAKVAWG